MTERLEDNYEDLPRVRISLGGEEFEATPFNTTLFTHLGRLACYDHVFFQTGQEDEKVIQGTYVFRSHSVYGELLAFMMRNGFPMVLNKVEAADCDVNAFNRMIEQQLEDIGDSFPDEWEENGPSAA